LKTYTAKYGGRCAVEPVDPGVVESVVKAVDPVSAGVVELVLSEVVPVLAGVVELVVRAVSSVSPPSSTAVPWVIEDVETVPEIFWLSIQLVLVA
jgi:hypothetical protein